MKKALRVLVCLVGTFIVSHPTLKFPSQNTRQENSSGEVRAVSASTLSTLPFAEETYLDAILKTRENKIIRWENKDTLLSVYIQPPSRTHDSEKRVAAVRRALELWKDCDLPIRFHVVSDSQNAKIRIRWITQFGDPISGNTIWFHNQKGALLEANIDLAIKHRGGETLDERATQSIALHETGHAIGLDHPADTASVMYPKVRSRVPIEADCHTAQLLYSLPLGPFKGGSVSSSPRR